MSNQQQRKFTPCFRKCGAMVCFDNYHKSKTGKLIPLIVETDSIGQETLVPHDCPNYKKGEQQQQPKASSNNNNTDTMFRLILERLETIEGLLAAR